MSYLFKTAYRYTLRHFREISMQSLSLLIAMIVLNVLVAITSLFPRIFRQLTRLQETETAQNPFSQGSESINMLRFFNGFLLLVFIILSLSVFVFLLMHTATTVKQFLRLEKESLQTRYQLVLDEKYVFEEFFLSRFFILLVCAPVTYAISVLLQQLILRRVMLFYGISNPKFLEIWFIPIIMGAVFLAYICWLMRKYAKRIYEGSVILSEF